MATRRWLMLGGLVLLGWLAIPPAAQLEGQQNAATDAPALSREEQELDVKYAQAYLKLMEATLRKYEEVNRGVANTIRPAVVQAGQQAVAKARERLQLAQGAGPNSQILVTRAQNNLRIVEELLRKAEAANTRKAGTILAGEVERLRAERELAQIKVERARVASATPESAARFELDELREDVQELQYIVAILRAGRL